MNEFFYHQHEAQTVTKAGREEAAGSLGNLSRLRNANSFFQLDDREQRSERSRKKALVSWTIHWLYSIQSSRTKKIHPNPAELMTSTNLTAYCLSLAILKTKTSRSNAFNTQTCHLLYLQNHQAWGQKTAATLPQPNTALATTRRLC